MHVRPLRHLVTPFVILGLTACGSEATAPELVGSTDVELAAAQPAEACVNVRAEAAGNLGPWSKDGFGGFGLQPTPITLGGVEGTMASFLLSETISGSKNQGAHHLILQHVFWADDGNSWFLTEDKASCAVSSNSLLDCRVNDNLRIVEGEGIFENAAGRLHNHGWIEVQDWGPPPVGGTLDLTIHGRMCGDGVSG